MTPLRAGLSTPEHDSTVLARAMTTTGALTFRVRPSMVNRRFPMTTDELAELERAGRRCSVCRSARGWRRFEIVRRAGAEPAVLCASCRARFGEAPPTSQHSSRTQEHTRAAAAEPRSPMQHASAGERERAQRPDRMRAALVELPSSFSTAMAARAARLSNDKALNRLKDLERHGEVRRVGKRWSTAAPPSDLTAAFDRLEARTTKLRIVRESARVA